MYKATLIFPNSKDSKIRTIDVILPFVPHKGLQLTFNDNLEDIIIECVNYDLPSNSLIINMEMLTYQDSDFKGYNLKIL